MKDKDFIQEYRNMFKMKDICEITGLKQSNVNSGNITDDKAKEFAQICKHEIIRLYSIIIEGAINE